jgi:hypothetical protein
MAQYMDLLPLAPTSESPLPQRHLPCSKPIFLADSGHFSIDHADPRRVEGDVGKSLPGQRVTFGSISKTGGDAYSRPA